MSADGPHSSSQHGLAAVHNVQVQALPQHAAGVPIVRATPLAGSSVAERHEAGGCWSPQLPFGSASCNHKNGITIELGAGGQQGGGAVRLGTAHYVAADGGTHQPLGAGAVPLRSALKSSKANDPLDFYLIKLDVATLGIQTTPADKCKRQPFITHQSDSSEVATPITTPNTYRPTTA